MKYNFILNETNVGEFKKRFDRLLSLTGMLVEYAEYKGTKRLNSVLPDHIRKDPLSVRLTEQTCNHFIDQDKYEYDTYPAKGAYSEDSELGKVRGIIIRTSSDSCIVIDFGTKIKFTPTHMITFHRFPFRKEGRTMRSIFKPESDIERGKARIRINEAYAEQYWEFVDDEIEGWFDED